MLERRIAAIAFPIVNGDRASWAVLLPYTEHLIPLHPESSFCQKLGMDKSGGDLVSLLL